MLFRAGGGGGVGSGAGRAGRGDGDGSGAGWAGRGVGNGAGAGRTGRGDGAGYDDLATACVAVSGSETGSDISHLYGCHVAVGRGGMAGGRRG